MKYSYSNQEIRAAEEDAIRGGVSSLVLMQRAGAALARQVLAHMKEQNLQDVLFVCGGGNNGGDGFTAAQILHGEGADVAVLCLAGKFSHDCAEAAKRYRGELFGRIPRRRYALIVDCIFGTGLKSSPAGEAEGLIRFLQNSGAYVISCDLPSGLAENGIALSPCVKADMTLTVGAMKNALLLSDGADMAGEIGLLDIGLSPSGGVEVWEESDVKEFFPPRKSNSHKGNYGAAAILSAYTRYSGAAFLSAAACLRAGCGYTKLFAGETLFPAAVGKLPDAVLLPASEQEQLLSADCVSYGMGEGAEKGVLERTLWLLENYSGKLILDADALNALASCGVAALKRRRCEVVITPHLGEMARLTAKSVEEVRLQAVELCKNFAAQYGITVALKSNRTVISNGQRTAICTSGSPALAKGGSGDVLAGFMAGTLARGLSCFEAASASCFLLGKAGELAQGRLGEYSVTPSDVIRCLPEAILSL